MIDAKYILNISKSNLSQKIRKIEKKLVDNADYLATGKEINVSLDDAIGHNDLIKEFENRGFDVRFKGSPNFQSQSTDYYLTFSIKKDLLNK